MNKKSLSIIIVTYNVLDETLRCLQSLSDQISWDTSEVIVVDNASSDGTVESLASKYPGVIVSAQKENLGFAKAINLGISISKGKNILFLNPDTVAFPEFSARLLHALSRNPNTAAVGPRAFWDPGRQFLISCLKIPSPAVSWLCHSGFSRFNLFRRFMFPHWETDWMYWTSEAESFRVPAIGGAYCLVRRSAIEKVGGGFDPEYFLGYEDVDLACRFRDRGWEMRAVPAAQIAHCYGASKRKKPESIRECASWQSEANLFIRKNYSSVKAASISGLLGAERLLKRFHRKIHSKPSEPVTDNPPNIRLEWKPPAGVSKYLVEIATSPCFFDKFGAFTSQPLLQIDASMLGNLSRGNYFYRVFFAPLDKKSPLAVGRFEV
jgi:O-antigen biosynthesis protein